MLINGENIPYATIPIWVLSLPDLTTTDIAVYAALASFADNNTRGCYPSQPTLLKRAHIRSENTLRKSLMKLENAGAIYMLPGKGRKATYYKLLPVPPGNYRADSDGLHSIE